MTPNLIPDLAKDESAHDESTPADSKTSGMEFQLSDAMMMMPFAEARANALRDFDRYFLSAALARHAGNVARTARALGLHRQSLQKLMARRGLKSGRATVPATT
jgi:transcriptional regulator with GAF, ATPase, and Fis domain